MLDTQTTFAEAEYLALTAIDSSTQVLRQQLVWKNKQAERQTFSDLPAGEAQHTAFKHLPTPGRATSRTYQQARGEVRAYSFLPEGWAGQDTKAPILGTVLEATLLLSRLESYAVPVPKSSVSGDGEILLYWHFEGFRLELSLFGDSNIYFLVRMSTEEKAIVGELPFESDWRASRLTDHLARVAVLNLISMASRV